MLCARQAQRMAIQLSDRPRFGLADEDGMQRFLAANPRALVLFRGIRCPYSVRAELMLDDLDTGWARCVRLVEHGGRGPVGERHGIDITPTLVAYANGVEVSRHEATTGIGFTRRKLHEWARGLKP